MNTPANNVAPNTETAETATPAPAVATEAKAPKVQREKRNGVTRPSPGTMTGRVWDIADEISRSTKRPALRDEVMKRGLAEGIAKGTVATQYGRWCTFYEVTAAARSSARSAEKEAAAAAAAATPAETAPAENPDPVEPEHIETGADPE